MELWHLRGRGGGKLDALQPRNGCTRRSRLLVDRSARLRRRSAEGCTIGIRKPIPLMTLNGRRPGRHVRRERRRQYMRQPCRCQRSTVSVGRRNRAGPSRRLLINMMEASKHGYPDDISSLIASMRRICRWCAGQEAYDDPRGSQFCALQGWFDRLRPELPFGFAHGSQMQAKRLASI
jgi:hypothetical protein